MSTPIDLENCTVTFTGHLSTRDILRMLWNRIVLGHEMARFRSDGVDVTVNFEWPREGTENG